MARILHVLSQRPMLTGSGVTLDALVRCAGRAGHEQVAVCGIPASDTAVRLGDLGSDAIRPLRFETGELAFPVPGMSDVMPYSSTVFSAMSEEQLTRYRDAWRGHLAAVIGEFRPALIHSHHVWILGSLIKDVAPQTPVVTHCHATGLRQMVLCPHLADEVRRGCARNDRFAVLHRGHQRDLAEALGVARERVHVVGAGYRDELFHTSEDDGSGGAGPMERAGQGLQIAYAGKFSRAKGLPWLLDAFERVAGRARERSQDFGLEKRPVLHIAGSGAGAEADGLRARMEAMRDVVLHGQLDQAGLAALLRRTDVFALPSFYEGLPLVLVEAMACGNHLIATRLPGIEHEIAPHCADWLDLIEPPRLRDADRPVEEDLPGFVDALAGALERALEHHGGSKAMSTPPAERLRPFTWDAVFERVEAVWHALLSEPSTSH